VPLDRAVSLETEIYPTLALEGLLRGSAFDAPFIDIGTPEDFARAQTFVPDALRRYEGKAIAGEVP
jgi:D-glycero-D-manno-heptose 1,7-bisphosphate phosphatase